MLETLQPGMGVTANHYARNNEVIAIEPSIESVNERWSEPSGIYSKGKRYIRM